MTLLESPTTVSMTAASSASHWTDFAMCKGRTALFFPPKAERPQAASDARHVPANCARSAP